MNQNPILNNVAKHIQLTRDEEQHFLSLLRPVTIKRKHLLLREGDNCKFSAFVTRGVLRSFNIDESGVERVLAFAPVDWWIGDLYSFFSDQPAILSIDALEETEALLLMKADQEKLYEQVPVFERYFRIAIQNSLVANQQRLLDNMVLSAEDRYLKFCKRYPTLINTVPQKDIAAYLGITPEFFSKMKNEMMKKK